MLDLRRHMLNFYIPVLCVGLFWSSALLARPVAALAEDYGESLLDIAPVELMQKEAPFTDEELARYLADYETAKGMADTEANKFFADRGWRNERLIYITVKIALGLEDLQSGESSSLKDVPKALQPTKTEQKIIKAHAAEIEKIFIVEH